MKFKKSGILLLAVTTLFASIILPSSVSAEDSVSRNDVNFQGVHVLKTELNEGKIANQKTGSTDASFFAENDKATPFADDIGCYSQPDTPQLTGDIGLACSRFGAPVQLSTNKITIVNGVALEYTIKDGQFAVFTRPDLYYYQEQATQSWFNAAVGKFTQTFTTGYGTYLTYKVAGKNPYMAKLMDKFRNQKPFPYGNWALGAGAWMLANEVPLWGDIIAAPVPAAGTKEVIVYLSKTGKDNTWHYRTRFTISPSGSVTYKTWTVGI
ncbi:MULTISPECIES: hypothetical protein [Paenibacillus]|uniref:Uncharacterized protein n=1 Tax=Paenibacillus campinasensis TaxID=66347 RepID=A0ABW9T3W8_9BACL|nr:MULTISPECIES: hypothetical protein [Paenibacillus]MUG67988.1 hypothetical protein [Paenibacillus campinasensis]PAK55752.1 hypothetical protein CHH75_00315 [Paenibacillus sp. 7541]